MKLSKGASALLLVLVMAAPSWSGVAGAQAPVPIPNPGVPQPQTPKELDPLRRLFDDLQDFLGQLPQLGEQVAPVDDGLPEPSVGGVQGFVNATQGDLISDVDNATNSPIRILYYEGFEGDAGLIARGWTQEVVRGRAPWGVADTVNKTVTRMDGTTFTPEFESGESRFMSPRDGRKTATILNPAGRYDARVDARLISPPIDLRYVPGASARTDDPYDLLTDPDSELGAPYQALLGAWRASIAPFTPGVASWRTPGQMFNWLLVTPPSDIQRLYLVATSSATNRVVCLDPERAPLVASCGGEYGDTFFVNPLAERYGAALINLTFYHKYDFPSAAAGETDAFLDGAFLEARVVNPDGTVGPWEHLIGDTIFEPTINRNTSLPLPFGESDGGPGFLGFLPVPVGLGEFVPIPISAVQPPVSGQLDATQEGLAGGSEYAVPHSWYWGRVQTRPYTDCYGYGTQRVDCQPDVPAFVTRSAFEETGVRVKSHFTLNRFVGHEIQLAWRVHSGVGSTTAADLGWSLDGLKVEALLHQRDPGVEGVAKPRPGDQVPTTILLQPEASIKNFGYQGVEGVRVNFTILDDVPGLTREQLLAIVGGADPATLPGIAQGVVQGQLLRQPRVLLRSSTTIPALEPLESVVARSPVACLACAPGAYRLVVEVSTAALSGGAPGSLPTDRVEDGTRANNRLEVPFVVVDKPEAAVRVSVTPATVLTDINEPKTLRLEVENRGNMALTGTVEVTAQLLDPDTFQPAEGQPRVPVGALVVNEGDLPAGKRLTAFGSDRDTLLGNITWSPTNLAPGVYQLSVVFKARPQLAQPAADQTNAFIRATPTAYFPGDGRASEDFERLVNITDFFDREVVTYAGIAHQGWRKCVGSGAGGVDDGCDPSNAFAPRALPQGPVSLNHTWNATAADGAIAELTVLSLLAGNPGVAGLPNFSPTGNSTFRVGPLVVRFPNVTLDPDRGTLTIPPIVVEVPRIELVNSTDPSIVILSLPPKQVNTALQTVPVNLSAPNTTLTLPPVVLETAAQDVRTGLVDAQVPPFRVRLDSVVVAVFGGGGEPSALRVTIPAATLEVPSITNSLTGGSTMPFTVRTEPATQASPPLGPLVTPAQRQNTTEQTTPGQFALPLNLTGSSFYAGVLLNDTHLKACVRPHNYFGIDPCPTNVTQAYNATDATLSGSSASLVGKHSYLNDYYLTRTLDLRGCNAGCAPTLSFWHLGKFQWNASTPREAPYPGAREPLDVPTAIQGVDPLQRDENASRGLIEAMVLSDQGATVRQDVLPERLGLAEPCSVEGLCTAALPCVNPRDVAAGDVPAMLPVIGQAFADQTTCGRDLLQRPVDDGFILGEYREAVRTWKPEEIRIPQELKGKLVQLTFHFQTTLGRITENATKTGNCVPTANAAVVCARITENWALDNIRVHDASNPARRDLGFVDTVGDNEGDTSWLDWRRFRTMREVVDQNVVLDGRCYAFLNRPVGQGAGNPDDLAACLAAEPDFKGTVIGVDGRGWDVWTAGRDLPQRNGFENPFYDGWFMDGSAGFQTPGAEDPSRNRALRWGGPGTGGYAPHFTAYDIASTRLLSLAASARPYAEFLANYSFSRADSLFNGGLQDGASVFLARYQVECSDETGACPLVFKDRVIVTPEAGYPELVKPALSIAQALNVPWDVLDKRGAQQPNGFAGRSGTNPRHSEYVPVRIDLQQALDRMCLKAIVLEDGARYKNHSRAECEELRVNVTWSNGQGVHTGTGLEYRNITRFEEDPEGLYALEFHTANTHSTSTASYEFGLAIDELRIAEQFLANDLGLTRQVFPKPGAAVGPGETIQVRVNVTNFGLFTQRGVRLHFNVTQQGVQVFPDPTNASRNPVGCDLRSCSQLTPLGAAIPGLRDPNPQHNVSFAFENPWVPRSEGLFEINSWVGLVGELVGGRLVPLEDENHLNDRRTERVEVRKVHSVRLLPAEEMADESVVLPLVGTTEDRRTLRVLLENLGTVAEGAQAKDFVDLDGDGQEGPGEQVPRSLRVRVDIFDETGQRLANVPDPRSVDLIAPGKTLPVEFVWQPPSGGLFTVRFTAESDLDLLKSDNERAVRVLVLTQLIPPPGASWEALFSPEGTGWHNDSRFDPKVRWSFGSGDTYGPLEEGSLVLDEPVDLTNFRNAILTLNHSYDLELGYDGGVVEVSADGRTWEPVAPLRTTDAAGNVLFEGYPAALTTASRQVPRAGDEVRAFTGDSGGRVTSVIPLGTAAVTRTEPVVLLRDTFDPEAVLAGADLTEGHGQWVEVRSKSVPPAGKAWWVGKDLIWRQGMRLDVDGSCAGDECDKSGPHDIDCELYNLCPGAPNGSPNTMLVTFEGTKTLFARADGNLTIPRLDAPLVVEYDEWRGLGLSRRGSNTCQALFCNAPNSVEVTLERLNATTKQPDLVVQVLPRAADTLNAYGDNYLEWTRRSIILPAQSTDALAGQPARLAFRMYLANSNAEGTGPFPRSDMAYGTGGLGDTDFFSPHLGWAVASPRIYYLASRGQCEGLAGASFQDGKCLLFQDDLQAYPDGDAAASLGPWSGAWQTDKLNRTSLTYTLPSGDLPSPGALAEAGWKLVDAVRLVTDKPAWDLQALAPPRSGKGLVAEATGSGVDTRLVTPLNLRSAASEVTLRLDHSFKFSDFVVTEPTPPTTIAGSVSGGRVEVSRDGGKTWEPLAPKVPLERLNDGSVNKLAYTRDLADAGFARTFARGTPVTQQQCSRPTHAGCLDPADPFATPGGWQADDQPHDWEPFASQSAHTPFGSPLTDPERDSPFGIGSLAFGGSTCANLSRDPSEPCGQAEDWRQVEFDLTPYAGQDVLLGLHAFFTTHRFAAEDHLCLVEYNDIDACTGSGRFGSVVVPRDYWRVDNVTVESRVLDGKPLFVRLRGFSDANGEAGGWDIYNVTLLGDRHLRNLGVRLLSPAEAAPIFGAEEPIDARVVNRGQQPLKAAGTLVVEQVGNPALRNGGFEAGFDANWTLELGAGTLNLTTAEAAEGKTAARFVVDPGAAVPFRLSQRVKVPAGHWRLVGTADVGGSGGTVGAQVLGVAGDDGKPDPRAAFPKGSSTGNYTPFEVPFVVEGDPVFATVQVLASRNLFGDFSGFVHVDHLRLEPRPPPGAAPAHDALVNPSFEQGLEGWTLEGGIAGISGGASGRANRWNVSFPVATVEAGPSQSKVARGSAPQSFFVDVTATNATKLTFTVEVATQSRPVEARILVNVTAPDGTFHPSPAFPVLRPLVVTGLQNPLTVLPPGAVPGPFVAEVALPAAPGPFDVSAPSKEQALRDPQVPPPRTTAVGRWNVTVQVVATQPLLEGLHEQIAENALTLRPKLDRYDAQAAPVAASGSLDNIFDGTSAAVVASRGLGPGDFDLHQALNLAPGKYRLEGLLGTREARVNLVPDSAADAAKVAGAGSLLTVRQELDPRDLPRRITGLVFYGPQAATDGLDVWLEDANRHVLATENDLDITAAGIATTAAFTVHVPLGGPVYLVVRRTAGAELFTKEDGAYANGTLRDADNVSLNRDLKVTFLGAVETTGARSVVAFAGGSGAANRAGPPDGQAAYDLPLNASTAYHARQVVPLTEGMGRRLTSVSFQVEFPAAGNVAKGRERPDNENEPLNYSLRQGQVRVQLLDLAGKPLSEEAMVPEYEITAVTLAHQKLDPRVKTLTFNFSNAVLPADATAFQVGIRVINFTAANPARVRTVNVSTDADPLHMLDGALTFDGASVFYGHASSDKCRFTEPNETLQAPFGCDVPMELTFVREGILTVEVPGTQAGAVRFVQPAATPATFATQNGGVPFRLDFVVQPGRTAVGVHVRGDAWQGDVILDGLRLVPLTQAAVTIQADVAPGRESALLAPDGNAPRITALRGAAYRITAEAASVDGAGTVLGELLLGDNRATRTTGPALGPGRLALDQAVGAPNSLDLATGPRTALSLVVRNEGATEAELLRATGTLETKDGRRIAEFTQADFDPIPENVTFGPLERRVLSWPFQPDPTLAHGVYVLKATIATQPLGDEPAFESSAQSLLYLGTNFHDQFAFEWRFGNNTLEDELARYIDQGESMFNTQQWTSEGRWNAQYPADNECNPLPQGAELTNGPCNSDLGSPIATGAGISNGEKNWFWYKTDERNLSAFRGISLGGDPAFPVGFPVCCQQQGTSSGTVFAAVRSRSIPIADMQRPQLLYADRHDFNGLEVEGSIFARLVNQSADSHLNYTAFPEGDCISSYNVHGWVPVEEHIVGASPGFASGKWVLRNVDLGPLIDRAVEETGDLERWTHVQLCWHVEQPSPNTGANLLKEWSIDDVLVSPYGIGLTPGQRIPITDNVSKDFRLVLRNRGAYTDTYRLSLEEETGLPSKGPSNWNVTLRDAEGRPLREVQVAPGEEKTVVARVRVDLAPPTLAREGTIDIAITAVSLTTALLRSTQHLLFDVTYEDRPNLRIAGLIVNDATLSVDKPRTVDVLVQNTGSVVARDVHVAVVDKMDPSFGVPPEELRQLDGTALPGITLAPGDTQVLTVNWIPHLAGEHNVTAIADPAARLLEFDERDNVLVKPILVPKAEFPDLLVEAVASTTNPGPGDLVEVQMRITNKGGAPATGIQVSIRAGVTDLLPGEPPHVLPLAINPGDTHVLNASWRPAFPGEQTIILRAKTFAGILETLDTSGDNVVLLVIKVRSRGLDLVLPPDVEAKPGELVNATIEVHNRGDVDDTYRLTIEPPEDWRGLFLGQGEDIRLSVGNHSHRNLTVQLGPPRHAEAGPAQVRLRVVSENASEALEAHLTATVPQAFGIRFSVEPEHLLLPGQRLLPLTLTNGGNGLDLVTVRARSVPAGWSVEPTTFGVAARSTAQLRINVTSPTTTPEGVYALVLEAQGRRGDLLAQGTKVLIQPYELLHLEVQGVPALLVPGSAHEGSLVVRNGGNVPARADLALEGPAGWRLRLERDVVAVNPGEARALALGLAVPANATDAAQALRARAVSGRDATYQHQSVLRAASADLAVLDLETLPRGQVRDGATLTLVVTLANRGEVPLPTPLAVYVDDVLLGFENGPVLAPGEEARLNLSVRARGGEHVVLVVADPAGVLGEADETNNAHLLVQRVDRGAGLFAVPGPEPFLVALAVAGLALVLGRRKPPGPGPARRPQAVDR